MTILSYIALFLGSYFIGGLSPAVLISRSVGGFDIREKGSGNPGSTNVLRTMGWKWGLLTVLSDTGKAALCTGAGLLLMGYPGAYFAAGGVLLGHAFSPYMKFKGGKCVASSLGVILVLSPILALITMVAGVLVMALTGLVSLGSLVGFLLFTISAFFIAPSSQPFLPYFAMMMTALSLYLHRKNIVRLFTGKENRMNFLNNIIFKKK